MGESGRNPAYSCGLNWRTQTLPVRPELVEGLPFFARKKVQGFDRLSPNGERWFYSFVLRRRRKLARAIHAPNPSSTSGASHKGKVTAESGGS